MKHTPGPWKVSEPELTSNDFPTKHPHYEITSGSSVCWIAHVLCFSDANKGTQYEADAQLIAAAPDLLEAAELLIKNLPDGEYVGLGHLRKAVHKAKGIA